MTSAEDFLHAILDEPDDDVPRLVFADWLEERGDRRGEFIRLQCDLEQLSEDDPQRPERESRSHLLQSMYERRWLGELIPLVHRWRFRRGFVDWVQISTRTFLGHAEELFQLAPIREVTLNDVNPHLRDLAESAYLAKLTSLDIKPEFSWRQNDYPETLLDDEGLRVLLGSQHLTGLKRMDLGWNSIGDRGVLTLSRAKTVGYLTDLDLSHNQIRGETLVNLANSRHCSRLRCLGLNNNPLLSFLRCFSHTAHFKKLEILHLESNGLTDTFLLEMSEKALRRLRQLFLDGNQFTAAGVRALVGSPAIELNVLSLNSVTANGDEVAEALAESSHLRKLQRLSFRHNSLGPKGARALAAATGWDKLRVLDVRDNAIGDAGVINLSRSLAFSGLVTLHLSANGLHDDGARALADSPYLERIAELRLGNNPIGAAARYALQSRFGHRVIFDS